MRKPVRLYLAGLLSGASVAGMVVLATAGAGAASKPLPESAAAMAADSSGASTAFSASTASSRKHPNVGNTHSPRLERELAGTSTGGTVNAPAQSASTTALQGVDVASFQHPNNAAINWASVASGGVQFAAVKATEGDYYTNPFAPGDLSGAKAAGLSIVAYAFAIPDGDGSSASPVTQANDLVNYLQTGTVGVPPIMLDIEYNPNPDGHNSCYGLSQSAMVTWIKGFDAQIQAKTGSLPLIYTTADWWKTCTGNTTALGQAPLWIADIGSTSPALPAGWQTYDFWQYSSTGTVSGITGNVDLDQVHAGMVPLLNPGNQPQAAGSSVDMKVASADPVAGQALTYSASGLPGGLSLDSSTGQITGWISQPGTHQATVTATDAQGDTGSVNFTWTAGTAPIQASGAVHLDLAGKCLSDVAGATAAGTQASIYTCNGSNSQHWYYRQDETLRFGGKCLSVASSAAGGTKPALQVCHTFAGQRWRLVYPRGVNASAGATPIGFRNVGSGKCLSDPGSNKTNGTRVIIASCGGGPNQAWRLPAGPLQSQVGGKCADDRSGNTADGAIVDDWSCNTSNSQKWLTWFGGNLAVNGKCLTVTGGATTAGTLVELSTCGTSGSQQWHMVPAGDGVNMQNPQSGLCLADPGDSAANGTQLQILTCDASDPGMIWRAS